MDSGISQEEFEQIWELVHDLQQARRPIPDFEPTSEVNQLSNDELGDHIVKIGFVYGHYNGVVTSAEKLHSGLKKMMKDETDGDNLSELRSIERALVLIVSTNTRHQKIWSGFKDTFSRTVETRVDGNRNRKPGSGRKPVRPGGTGIARRE